MTADLTPADYAYLILLRDADREISNTEMEKLYRVRLVSPTYAKLNSVGCVESKTKATPYRHKLTSEGRQALDAFLRPDGDGVKKDRVVWAALALLEETIRRGRDTGNGAAPVVETSDDLNGRIRTAYAQLAGEPGGWVNLTALRPLLGDVAKADVDKALEQLLDDPEVRLEPEPFGHRIRAEEKAAAVHVGGEDRHKLAIGRP